MAVTVEFNPVTLAIIALIGGAVGAVTTTGVYMLRRAAREVGEEVAPEEEVRITLPLPSSDLKRLPLPHELLAKLLGPAP